MNIFINLSVIFWSLFPSLMSYTQPVSTPLKVELRQLVANSDLLTPKASPNQNQAEGFTYVDVDTISLVNGIAKFTPTSPYGRMRTTLTGLTGNKLYVYTRFKTTSTLTYMSFGETGDALFHSGSGNFEFLSRITTITTSPRYPNVSLGNSTTYVPIEVDYIGAINITDLVSRGLLPSGLSDVEYITLLDTILSEIGGTFQGSYFYTETIADNYKWFSTGFVEKTGERDFIDYLGFFVWLVVPYLFAFLVYKLLKGVIYG